MVFEGAYEETHFPNAAVRNYAEETLGGGLATSGLLKEFTSITIAQAAPVLPYLMMVLMLIVRPTGLMGTRET